MTSPRVVLTVVLCLTVGALIGCGSPAAEEVVTEAVVPVRAEAAQVGDIRAVVHATGVVTPAPGAELIVVAPELARIAEIPRAAGDRVRRGDVLVRFEMPTATADVQRQRAEISRADASLQNARAAHARAGDLFERGVAARREVEDAARTIADAEAALAQAKAALGAAETVAARSTVRAAFDGVVARRFHNAGDLVEPSATDVVLRVIDPRRLEVVAAVALDDAARVSVGAHARMTSSAVPGGGLDLIVTAGAAAIDPGAATAPVRLAAARPVGIPAGTAVQLDIEAEQHRHVVLVPSAAIVRDADETYVFVAAAGKAHRRPVRVGLSDAGHTEILDGVARGDLVILSGQAGLPDGAPVTVAPAAEATPGDQPPVAAKGPPK
jgi:RND family efflux transporter MFP subunit